MFHLNSEEKGKYAKIILHVGSVEILIYIGLCLILSKYFSIPSRDPVHESGDCRIK